jgi:O-antigen ligase
MSPNRPISEYDPVAPAGRRALRRGEAEPEAGRLTGRQHVSEGDEGLTAGDVLTPSDSAGGDGRRPGGEASLTASSDARTDSQALLKRGHAVTYAGLFLFTAFLYFRPYELIPSLSVLSSAAYYIALLTIAVFIPTQLSLEGNLSVRPREIKLVLLLVLTALLSLPLALNRGEAWDTFVEYLKVVAVFIVMMNAVRTERRLKMLLLLVLAASLVLSLGALGDYRAGKLTMGGIRVAGIIGGMFGNPNDLAMHLAMMIPITFGLLLSTRGVLKKLIYVASALLMGAALVVTFSRGGFLGLVAASGVLAWKLGRRNRIMVIGALLVVVVLFLAFAPGEYAGRLASIVDKSRDAVGSAGARQELLILSIILTIKNPLFGVGMGNFHIVSIHEQVSHNAYTQVGAELGVAAMVIYTLFVLSPFRRLRRIERETLADHKGSRDYYLAVCFQAAVVGYMVSSFFGSVAYLWYIYYLVAYAFCFSRIYEARRAASGETRAAAEALDREAPAKEKERRRRLLHAFDGGEAVLAKTDFDDGR